LLGIELLGRPPEQSAEQVLKLLLHARDRAIFLLVLLQQLLPLGAQQFILLLQLAELLGQGERGMGAVRAHAPVDPTRTPRLVEMLEILEYCQLPGRKAKRRRRLMLVRSIPASNMASSLAFSSTLAPEVFAAGRRNVPSSSRLYQMAKPSASQ